MTLDKILEQIKNIRRKKAVIIKGNPKYIDANKDLADRFYQALAARLTELGYAVEFDPGEPNTEPPKADLWVGHSRGMDRLRFAPEQTRTLRVDDYLPDGHYDPETGIPNATHWEMSDRLLSAISGMSNVERSREG